MDALGGSLHHADRVVTTIPGGLSFLHISRRQALEMLVQLSLEQPRAGHHRLEEILEVVADIAQEAHHFGLLRFLEEPRLLDRQRSERRENGQQGKIMFVERSMALIQDVQHPDRLAFPPLERQRDHVPRHKTGGLIDTGKMAGTLFRIAGDGRLARLEHRPRDPFIPRDARPAWDRLLPDRILEDESLTLRICEEHRAGLRVHLVQGGTKRRFNQLVNLGELEECLTDAAGSLELALEAGDFLVVRC